MHDHTARFHEAVMKALKSSNIKTREAYFDLAVFYHRRVGASSKQLADTHKLAGLAKECCHEHHCWCKGHEDGH